MCVCACVCVFLCVGLRICMFVTNGPDIIDLSYSYVCMVFVGEFFMHSFFFLLYLLYTYYLLYFSVRSIHYILNIILYILKFYICIGYIYIFFLSFFFLFPFILHILNVLLSVYLYTCVDIYMCTCMCVCVVLSNILVLCCYLLLLRSGFPWKDNLFLYHWMC
jgi:hypothetical protein